MTSHLLNAAQTAQALPWSALVQALREMLDDSSVVVPPRLVQPLPGGASLFVMPAHDALIAITKLITFTPGNERNGLPSIQGDIVIFDVRTGRRLALIDGPTVTARRTAAVSLLAAQTLAPQTKGPLLIVGAGVQGLSHLEAFHAGLGIEEVFVHSRSRASSEALAERARALGLRAQVTRSASEAMQQCPLVVTTTPAQEVVMRAMPRPDAFVAAVGAFTPKMLEWDAEICRRIHREGRIVVDTRDADHEAGDLLQAGLDVSAYPTLAGVLSGTRTASPISCAGPVFFKSCGWAGWDLAAARCVTASLTLAGT